MKTITELAIDIDNYLNTLSYSELEALIPALMCGHGVPEKAKGLGLTVSDVEHYIKNGFINPYQLDRIAK